MAETPLTLSNRALQKLGAAPITSLDVTVDTSERAQTMCTLYEPILRAALQEVRWKFAQVSANLRGWSCTPVHTYNCAYVVPGDMLQIESTTIDVDEPWELSSFICGTGNSTCYTTILVTNDCSPISVTYTSFVTNPTLWPPLFREAFVTELAYQASFSVTASQSRVDGVAKDRELAWRKAKAKDGQSQKRLARWSSPDLLIARFGSSGRWPLRNEDF